MCALLKILQWTFCGLPIYLGFDTVLFFKRMNMNVQGQQSLLNQTWVIIGALTWGPPPRSYYRASFHVLYIKFLFRLIADVYQCKIDKTFSSSIFLINPIYLCVAGKIKLFPIWIFVIHLGSCWHARLPYIQCVKPGKSSLNDDSLDLRSRSNLIEGGRGWILILQCVQCHYFNLIIHIVFYFMIL